MGRRMIMLVVSATALALCACTQLSVPAYAGHLPLITQSRRCDETGISPDSVELRLWLSIGPSTLKSLPRLDATVRILGDDGAVVHEFQHVARPGLRVILAPQRVQLRITQAGIAADERPTLVLERGSRTLRFPRRSGILERLDYAGLTHRTGTKRLSGKSAALRPQTPTDSRVRACPHSRNG